MLCCAYFFLSLSCLNAGPPSVTVATGGGRSFDPAELSDSSEEDDNLFVAAPPDYQDVVR